MKKKPSKIIKYVIIAVVVILFIVLGVLVYNSLFASSNSTRLDGVEQHVLTKKEKEVVKEKLNELGSVDSVDVYRTAKILKIVVNLKEDIDLEQVKNISNESLKGFSEENLSFYDVEIFFTSDNEDSELYPQIGYKHKTSEGFEW